jgi:hypothetical protein
VRRASAIIAAVIVGASGLILASPGLANASTASCTGNSAYLLVSGAGDGIGVVPTVSNNTFQPACQRIYWPNTRTAMKFRPTEGSPCGKLHEPLEKE